MGKWHLMGLCVALLLLLGFHPSEGSKSVAADARVELDDEVGYVALTFDDGPRRITTARLLDGLEERGVNATFFLIGRQIEENRDLVVRMQAEGHQVGNHTWDHVRLHGMTAQDMLFQLQETDEKLQEILGEGEYWVRPPYGQIDEEEKALVSVPMIRWSVDPRDWESQDVEQIVAHVLQDVTPGSIILMHDIYPTSVDAALEIVDALQEKGYRFVTVEELFALSGVQPQAGVLYLRADR